MTIIIYIYSGGPRIIFRFPLFKGGPLRILGSGAPSMQNPAFGAQKSTLPGRVKGLRSSMHILWSWPPLQNTNIYLYIYIYMYIRAGDPRCFRDGRPPLLSRRAAPVAAALIHAHASAWVWGRACMLGWRQRPQRSLCRMARSSMDTCCSVHFDCCGSHGMRARQHG